MSMESVLAFIQKTSNDATLQSRIASLGPDDAGGLVQVASSAGFPFSVEELREVISKAESASEVGDGELEQVSGGLNPQPLPPRIARGLFSINPGLMRGIILVSGLGGR